MWWTNTNVKGQRVKFRFLSLPLLLLSFQFLMVIRMFPVLCMCLLLLRLGETYFFRDVHVRINSMLSELSSFGMSLSNMLDAPSFSQVTLQCHHLWKRTHCLPAKWIKSLMKIPSGKCSKSEWLMNWVFLSTRNQWSRSQRCIFHVNMFLSVHAKQPSFFPSFCLSSPCSHSGEWLVLHLLFQIPLHSHTFAQNYATEFIKPGKGLWMPRELKQ